MKVPDFTTQEEQVARDCPEYNLLGVHINVNDYDVGRIIGSANASMGALEIFLRYHHVDMYSK